MHGVLHQLKSKVSIPWLVLTFVFIAVIWGNSLVPGEGSGSMSLSVVERAHDVLRALGLPYEWLTNFILRKAAHFTEYAVLGVLASNAFDSKQSVSRGSIIAAALLCVLVPSIDETIQLFVSGRSGQVTDVLLDCCGATTGIAVRSAMAVLMGKRKGASKR